MGSPPAGEQRVVGGRYRLLHQLGRGAMGPMWRADDDLLERAVAIKQVVLPRRSKDLAEVHERILREARAAALFIHRHAVTVLDVIEDDGQPWIVTELLAAESLARLVARSGPLPPPRVTEIGRALLSALEAAHSRGIVHRDVRPGNVLLSSSRIVLSDFGTPTLDGDPAYTAPERDDGSPLAPAADLWSLGATLYFAVQGEPPAEGGPAARADAPLTALLDGLLCCDPGRRLDAAGARTLLTDALDVRPDQPRATAPSVEKAQVEQPAAEEPPPPTSPPPPQWQPPPPLPPPRRRLRARVLGAGRPPATQRAAAPSAPDAPPAPLPVTAAGPALTQFTSDAGWRVAIPAGWRSDSLGRGDHTFVDASGAVTITIRSTPASGHDPLLALKARCAAAQVPQMYTHYLDAVPYRGYRAADYDRSDHPVAGPALRTRMRSFVAGSRTYEISVTAPANRWGEGGPCFAGATDTFVPA